MPEHRTVSIESIVSVVRAQVSADLDGEAIILHLDSGTYYGLSGVGARIWNLIQEPRSVSDVRDSLLKEYDVEPARCEREVLALLVDLEARELIEVHPQSEPPEPLIVVSSGSP